MRVKVSTPKRILALLSCAVLCLTAIGTECFRSFIIGAETNTESIITSSHEFDFNDKTDLAKAYAYKKDYLPEISTDADKSVLEMNSGSGKVYARLPFKLEAGKKYNYSISYRVAEKNDPNNYQSTVLKLISSGKNDNINTLAGAGTARNLSTLVSWAELKVNSDYTTLSGSFEATASKVTDAYKFLTVHYETNKNFQQKIYIDKISIYADLSDVTGSYEFDFNNPTELAKAYAYPEGHLPEISKDGDKNVLEMNSENGKVYARLPFKLEAGKKYNYSVSYRVASRNDPDNYQSAVLKLISSGKNDNINTLAGAGTVRNLSTLVSWAEIQVSDEYTTLSGSFEATDSNVTDAYQYLTVHYETNKNFQQKIYIDKISIYADLSDVTGSYEFDFNNPTELAKAYAYPEGHLPEISKDGDKNVLEMNSGNGKVYARLPFKLEAGKKYNYSISYRVASKNDPNNYQSTVLKLISSGKNDNINTLAGAGAARNLSTLVSWAELKVNSEYTTLSGSFEATASNVTGEYQYLTIHYQTNKNFEQTLYIDKLTIEDEETPVVMPDVTGSYEFDFNNKGELAKAYAYPEGHLPEISKDGDKNVLEMNSGNGKVYARLPFKLEAGKKYNYSVSYRVAAKNDPNNYQSTVLKLISSGKNENINTLAGAGTARNLSVLVSWTELKVNNEYTTLSGSFEATASNVTDTYQYLTVHYETNKNFEQTLYIDKIIINSEETPEVMPDVTGAYEFDFNNKGELAKAYSYPGGHLPEISQDGNKNVLEMNSGKGKVFARLPFKLEAGRTYNYSVSYRVALKDEAAEGKTTVLKLISSGKNDNINTLAGAGTARNLSVLLSWKEVKVSNEYTTLSGSFEATDSNVTGEYQYLTIHYETNKNFEQTLYIDKIIINSEETPEVMPDVTGAYEFDFNNKGELAKAYSYPGGHLPEISQDGNKNVLEMNSGKGKVFARLPFKLEAGRTYNYSVSYRVALKDEAAEGKTTVLKLISSGKNDNINTLAGAGTARNLSVLLSWKEVKVSNEYTTLSGSFEATASNVTGEYQYLTIHYETNKNFEQMLYIDKIIINSEETPEPMPDVTGSYDFDFNNKAELAKSYSYSSSSLPKVSKDGDKNVLEVNSESSKVFVRLPFKLDSGKIYKYSISYRVASKNDPNNYQSTVLKLISSGKNDNINTLAGAGKTRNLSTILSWQEVKVSNEYTTVRGDFTTTDSNVTDKYQYLTIHYETNKNFQQKLYIDKISVWEYTIPEARNKYENPVTFEFDNMDDIDYTSNDTAQIDIDPAIGKEALRLKATRAGVAVRLPYQMKADMAYKITLNYRVDKTVDDKYYLQIVGGTRDFEPNFWCDDQKKAYLLKELLYWAVIPESNEYTTLQTVLFIKAKNVANDNGWFTLRLKSGTDSNVNFYIDSVTVNEMTYLDAAHNVDIMDYNWSANPESTAKYVDWEKWISTTAAVDSNSNTKNGDTKKGDTKTPDAEDSLNIGIIVGIVAAAVAAAAGVSALILFRRKRKKQ